MNPNARASTPATVQHDSAPITVTRCVAACDGHIEPILSYPAFASNSAGGRVSRPGPTDDLPGDTGGEVSIMLRTPRPSARGNSDTDRHRR